MANDISPGASGPKALLNLILLIVLLLQLQLLLLAAFADSSSRHDHCSWRCQLSIIKSDENCEKIMLLGSGFGSPVQAKRNIKEELLVDTSTSF